MIKITNKTIKEPILIPQDIKRNKGKIEPNIKFIFRNLNIKNIIIKNF